MIPPPIALGLTLCEQVIIDTGTNRVSAINSFNHVRVETFPYLLRPLCVYATLTGGQGEAELTLAVTHLETDEECIPT